MDEWCVWSEPEPAVAVTRMERPHGPVNPTVPHGWQWTVTHVWVAGGGHRLPHAGVVAERGRPLVQVTLSRTAKKNRRP